jgi:uncharacterized RDD family membrane protein YckC
VLPVRYHCSCGTARLNRRPLERQGTKMTSGAEQNGVYYQQDDYIGVGRRFFIDIVDGFVATIVSLIASVVLFAVMSDDAYAKALPAAWIVVWFSYFVLLKGSKFRTIGYLSAGARIVDISGERPSLMKLSIRLLFAVFGPLNLLFDLFWISSSRRQALRDKFAHTYVIRRASAPAGSGPIVYAQYTIMGGSFLFQEVKTPVAVL